MSGKVAIRWCVMLACLLSAVAPALRAQQPSRDEKVTSLAFTLELNTIFPASVTVPEGWYSIMLRNGVMTDELDVQLDDEGGAKLSSRKAPSKAGKSSMLVRLTPGKHVFQVVGKPGWKTVITVTGKK